MRVREQTTERGQRLQRDITGHRAAERANPVVIPMGVELDALRQQCFVAYTAAGTGPGLEVGLCDEAGELVGRLRLDPAATSALLHQAVRAAAEAGLLEG